MPITIFTNNPETTSRIEYKDFFEFNEQEREEVDPERLGEGRFNGLLGTGEIQYR